MSFTSDIMPTEICRSCGSESMNTVKCPQCREVSHLKCRNCGIETDPRIPCLFDPMLCVEITAAITSGLIPPSLLTETISNN